MPYLKRDWIGLASGRVYGRAGDFVEVIRDYDHEHKTVKRRELTFIVRNEDLSENKEDCSPSEIVSEGAKSVQRMDKRKRQR
jgi:hypothetical protein